MDSIKFDFFSLWVFWNRFQIISVNRFRLIEIYSFRCWNQIVCGFVSCAESCCFIPSVDGETILSFMGLEWTLEIQSSGEKKESSRTVFIYYLLRIWFHELINNSWICLTDVSNIEFSRFIFFSVSLPNEMKFDFSMATIKKSEKSRSAWPEWHGSEAVE